MHTNPLSLVRHYIAMMRDKTLILLFVDSALNVQVACLSSHLPRFFLASFPSVQPRIYFTWLMTTCWPGQVLRACVLANSSCPYLLRDQSHVHAVSLAQPGDWSLELSVAALPYYVAVAASS